MLNRRLAEIYKTFISEVVNVLDERPHVAHCLALLHLPAHLFFVSDLVPGEGFAQNGNERTVPGEKHAVKIALLIDMLGRHVKTHERLAGPRHAGYKADGFLALVSGMTDDF